MADATESRRILDLLAQGKITVDQADQLLRAIGGSAATSDTAPVADQAQAPGSGGEGRRSPKWLCMTIDKTPPDGRPRQKVNIRVPMSLLRSGMKIAAVVPQMASDALIRRLRERGVDISDLSRLDLAELDNVIRNLGEMTIDLDGGRAQIRFSSE